MGRPPKPKKIKLSARVQVWMTEEERSNLESKAKKLDISLSALLMQPWRKEQDHENL